MISDIQEKYDQLNGQQKDIFAGYGLRQIKHFVEISLPEIEAVLPKGAQVQGINAEGKVQALNPETGEYYLWISDKQWQLTKKPSPKVDVKADILAIWDIFNLSQYALIDLSHIHRDFLENQPA
ncbi:MAG: hypothetical protein ACN6OV_00020 [Acinetobacter sp.]|uniref:hypothetical protein n=1 Tax=Acinetobacter sp. TaxID=472 RepID=UPI003D05B2AD